MEFEVIYSPRAKIEIFKALNYYFGKTRSAGFDLNNELKNINKALVLNPFYEIKYKNIRAIPLNTFP